MSRAEGEKMEDRIKQNLCVFVHESLKPTDGQSDGKTYESSITQRLDSIDNGDTLILGFEGENLSAWTNFKISPETLKYIIETGNNELVIACVEGLTKRMNRFKSALESIQAL